MHDFWFCWKHARNLLADVSSSSGQAKTHAQGDSLRQSSHYCSKMSSNRRPNRRSRTQSHTADLEASPAGRSNISAHHHHRACILVGCLGSRLCIPAAGAWFCTNLVPRDRPESDSERHEPHHVRRHRIRDRHLWHDWRFQGARRVA